MTRVLLFYDSAIPLSEIAWFGIFPYLQASKLTCDCFMGSSGRHKTSGLVTKALMTHSRSIQSFMLVSVGSHAGPVPQGPCKDHIMKPAHVRAVFPKRKTDFIVRAGRLALCLGGNISSSLNVTTNTILRDGPGREQSGLCFSCKSKESIQGHSANGRLLLPTLRPRPSPATRRAQLLFGSHLRP